MAASQETRNMALFCDFENVALGVREAKYAQFDINKVLEKLLLKGSIVVKKAYCDWERYKDFRAAMHYASENSYLALIDTLSSFLQAFTTLLTTDLPFLILDLPPVLLPSIPASTPISPVVRATDRRALTPKEPRFDISKSHP